MVNRLVYHPFPLNLRIIFRNLRLSYVIRLNEIKRRNLSFNFFRTMAVKFQGQCNLEGRNGKIAFADGPFYEAILGMYDKVFVYFIKTYL